MRSLTSRRPLLFSLLFKPVYAAHTRQDGPVNPAYLTGFNENVTIHFEPGKTYRLRFINVGAFSMANLWLDGHDMSIIELDGVETEAYPIDRVPLSTAQRVSVLVKARNDTTQDWRLNSYQNTAMYDSTPDTLRLWRYMRISYGNNGPQEFGPYENRSAFPFWSETELTPTNPEPMRTPDNSVLIPFNFQTYGSNKNYAVFNDTTFIAPQVPSLYTALSMGPDANNLSAYGPGSNAFLGEWLSTVEITLQNQDDGAHPFHLHGFVFQVVQKVASYADAPPVNESQVAPIMRDTVSVPGGGQVVLRVYVDAPGVWFFHCHIEWHLESGLAGILVAAPDRIQSQIKLPQVFKDHCAATNLPSEGNAAGIFSLTDFGSLPPQPKMFPVGWTGKATGAFIGCLISALLGLASIIVYGMSDADPKEEDHAEKEKWYESLWRKARN